VPIFSSKQFHAAWYAPSSAQVTPVKVDEGQAFDIKGMGKVVSAYWAGQAGLVTLKVHAQDEEGQTRLTGPRVPTQSWTELIDDEVMNLSMPGQFGAWSGRGNSELPSMDQLRRYVLCMSFPVKPDAQSNAYQAQQLYNARDRLERTLNIRDELAHSDILMLVVPEDEGMTPVALRGARPQSAHCSVIRIRVPRP
jgi:hypothetical protein